MKNDIIFSKNESIEYYFTLASHKENYVNVIVFFSTNKYSYTPYACCLLTPIYHSLIKYYCYRKYNKEVNGNKYFKI